MRVELQNRVFAFEIWMWHTYISLHTDGGWVSSCGATIICIQIEFNRFELPIIVGHHHTPCLNSAISKGHACHVAFIRNCNCFKICLIYFLLSLCKLVAIGIVELSKMEPSGVATDDLNTSTSLAMSNNCLSHSQ